MTFEQSSRPRLSRPPRVNSSSEEWLVGAEEKMEPDIGCCKLTGLRSGAGLDRSAGARLAGTGDSRGLNDRQDVEVEVRAV